MSLGADFQKRGARLFDRVVRNRESKPGPVKWHATCSRYHAARQPCDLYLRERVAKSGKIVQRWAH